MKDAIESTLPTHDEPEVAPTTIHGSKLVKEVIYIKIDKDQCIVSYFERERERAYLPCTCTGSYNF